MVKLSISDPTIRIIPSKKLLDFLTNDLKKEKLLPENVKKVLGQLNREVLDGTDKAFKSPNFDEREIAILRTLNNDCLSRDEIREKEDHVSVENDCEENEAQSMDDKTERVQDIPVDEDEEDTIKDSRPFLINSDLKWLFNVLQERRKTQETPYLHELMEGSEVLLPQNEYLERNPVLEARCRRLRKEQEAREYKAMTKNVDNIRRREPDDSIGYQLRQINSQLIAILQFVFSVAAGFAFGFIGIPLAIGEQDFGFRLLLGIMFALIIALAEIYFLAKKLSDAYEEKPLKPVYNDYGMEKKEN